MNNQQRDAIFYEAAKCRRALDMLDCFVGNNFDEVNADFLSKAVEQIDNFLASVDHYRWWCEFATDESKSI